jgi:23S rRNA pseudouridine1911/1915/1917 synthase
MSESLEEMEFPEGQDDQELYEHYRIEVDPGQTPLRIDKFFDGTY